MQCPDVFNCPQSKYQVFNDLIWRPGVYVDYDFQHIFFNDIHIRTWNW